jgi:RNA polymerase sigma-B factor
VASQVSFLVVVDRLNNDSDEELLQFRELARTQRVELRDAIVEEHLGLAKHLAGRFAYRGEPYDDLYQVACLALLKAVERFDPDRSIKFNSFAVPYMVGELKRHFRDKGWSVRAPRRIQELYLDMSHHVEELTHQIGRPPTVGEIADAMDEPVGAVLEAMEAGRMYRSDSLDHPRDDGVNPPPIEQEGDEMDYADTRSILIEAVHGLSPAEQDLIRMRFIDEMSQSAIARRLGVSQMQVSRLLAKSLQQLRDQFEENDKSRTIVPSG